MESASSTFLPDLATNLIASVLSILAVLFLVERRRRANLTFKPELPVHYLRDGNEVIGQLARVEVLNRQMSFWLNWAYDREPALMCRAWISFHDMSNGHRIHQLELMAGKWGDTPNPKYQRAFSQSGAIGLILINPQDLRHWTDIPAGAYSPLDIVVRFSNESRCYGYNSDGFAYNNRHPDWALEKGRYLVKIKVQTGGREFFKEYVLVNEETFQLVELPSPESAFVRFRKRVRGQR